MIKVFVFILALLEKGSHKFQNDRGGFLPQARLCGSSSGLEAHPLETTTDQSRQKSVPAMIPRR